VAKSQSGVWGVPTFPFFPVSPGRMESHQTMTIDTYNKIEKVILRTEDA